MNESKFIFNSIVTMVRQTYAFFLDNAWFRGIVTDVNLNIIKVCISFEYINVYKINLNI